VGCAYGPGEGTVRAERAPWAGVADGAGGRGASGTGGADGADAVGCTYRRSEGAALAGAGCTGPRTVRSAQAPHTASRTQHAQGAREAHDACGAAKALAIQRHMSKTNH
jgi:hypothetical protein